MIHIKKYHELADGVQNKLDAYIDNEFGHIPIVKETEWARPDWTIIKYEDREIASFYNIVLREIKLNGKKHKISGINNVITRPKFRGKGYASMLLSETEHLIFEEFACKYGVLLCADALIPFYNRLNWYQVNCPVYFEQSSGTYQWQANTMLLNKGRAIQAKEIKLNGLPW